MPKEDKQVTIACIVAFFAWMAIELLTTAPV